MAATQIVGGHRLRHEPRGAKLQHAHHAALILHPREHQDLQIRRARDQRLEHAGARRAGQPEIEQHQVGIGMLVQQALGTGCIGCGEHLHIRIDIRKQQAQCVSDQRMIVD